MPVVILCSIIGIAQLINGINCVTKLDCKKEGVGFLDMSGSRTIPSSDEIGRVKGGMAVGTLGPFSGSTGWPSSLDRYLVRLSSKCPIYG